MSAWHSFFHAKSIQLARMKLVFLSPFFSFFSLLFVMYTRTQTGQWPQLAARALDARGHQSTSVPVHRAASVANAGLGGLHPGAGERNHPRTVPPKAPQSPGNALRALDQLHPGRCSTSVQKLDNKEHKHMIMRAMDCAFLQWAQFLMIYMALSFNCTLCTDLPYGNPTRS